MTDETPYVCTESPERMPARAQQVRRLAAGLLSGQRHDRRVVLRFEPRPAELIDALVVDESACCAFLDFALTRGEQAVQLTVDASEGAEPLLASLHAVFDAAQSGEPGPASDPGDAAGAGGTAFPR